MPGLPQKLKYHKVSIVSPKLEQSEKINKKRHQSLYSKLNARKQIIRNGSVLTLEAAHWNLDTITSTVMSVAPHVYVYVL